MARLYISEFKGVGAGGTSNTQAPAVPANAEQGVDIGATSAQSNPMSPKTGLVMLNTDVACCLAFGSNPTADPQFHRMGANETRFYSVNPGEVIAVIAASS